MAQTLVWIQDYRDVTLRVTEDTPPKEVEKFIRTHAQSGDLEVAEALFLNGDKRAYVSKIPDRAVKAYARAIVNYDVPEIEKYQRVLGLDTLLRIDINRDYAPAPLWVLFYKGKDRVAVVGEGYDSAAAWRQLLDATNAAPDSKTAQRCKRLLRDAEKRASTYRGDAGLFEGVEELGLAVLTSTHRPAD